MPPAEKKKKNTETKKLDGPRYVKSSYFNEIYDLLQKETTKYKIYSVLLGSFRCLRRGMLPLRERKI